MIELFDGNRKENSRKSSKGNQLKWEKDGIWYKADYTGYEGLSEYVVSKLLQKSSMHSDEYVDYRQEEIRYKAQTYMGVSCESFLEKGEQMITLERLFQSTYGTGLNKMVYGINSHEERLELIVARTREITGLEGFGSYMSKMLTVDALFLNEDRHSHNIAIILRSDGTYRYCPIFDNGAGLLADTTMEYPLSGDVYKLMSDVRPKTFCDSFEEQLEIAEKLYGRNISFSFTGADVREILGSTFGYASAVTTRVENILHEQMRKYGYLFG